VTRVKAIIVLEYLTPEECSWLVFPRRHQNRWFNSDVWGTATTYQDHKMRD